MLIYRVVYANDLSAVPGGNLYTSEQAAEQHAAHIKQREGKECYIAATLVKEEFKK